jgi:hypothetical protein
MPNAGEPIATAFKNVPEDYRANKRRGLDKAEVLRIKEKVRKLLDAQLKAAGNKTIIISGEEISKLEEDEFGALHQYLSGIHPSVLAVGYIRPPQAFMESAFQQRIKLGASKFNVANLYPNYRKRFEKFINVLGKENVRFWRFEPSAFPSGCVVQDFCSRLGIQFGPRDVLRINEGLSLQAVALLYTHAKFGPDYGVGARVMRQNKKLVRRVARLKGPKLRFHSSLVRPVIESRQEDIRWMEAQIGDSLSEEYRDDEHAIRSENDLLTYSPDALRWLDEQLGVKSRGEHHGGASAQVVADSMHRLRDKLKWSLELGRVFKRWRS